MGGWHFVPCTWIFFVIEVLGELVTSQIQCNFYLFTPEEGTFCH